MYNYQELYDRGMARIREADGEKLLDLGAETKAVNRINREYMDSISLEMRFMDSEFANTSSSVFGHKIPYPIQCAAFCEGRLLNKVAQHWQAPYLIELAAGVADANTWLWAGHVSNMVLQQMINTGAQVVRIVKPFATANRDENQEIVSLLHDAEDRGCVAVGMDIDVFYGEKTDDENPYRYPFGPKSMDEMAKFVEVTNLPFIVKGVLSVSDALKCQEIGAKGIVVSHHGGEAIDYAVPILRVLPHIRKAVPEMVIFAETGFRRGSDVLKALALGADGVCLLTILTIAYAGSGRQGVTSMLETLAEELKRNMSICGTRTIQDVSPDILWLPYPDRNHGE